MQSVGSMPDLQASSMDDNLFASSQGLPSIANYNFMYSSRQQQSQQLQQQYQPQSMQPIRSTERANLIYPETWSQPFQAGEYVNLSASALFAKRKQDRLDSVSGAQLYQPQLS